MNLLLTDPYQYLDVFLLVFVRTLGLLLIIPILGNRVIPYMVKISFSFFITLIAISTITFSPPVSSFDAVNFGLVVILEFITGWLLGFVVYMIYSVLSLAGQFVDMQIGFSMVNVFDPMSQIQLTITGNLYYYVMIIIVVVTRAHHFFIRALLDSFVLIPLGEFTLSPLLNDSMLQAMSNYFSMALRIAAPIFFVMIITNVILGILARTVPQLNMFVIGFPVKILLGLFTIVLTLSFFSVISDMLIGRSETLMRDVIEGMRPR